MAPDPPRFPLGALVVPLFDGDRVVLLPTADGLVDDDDFYISTNTSPAWSKEECAVVLARQGSWLKILVPGGGVGWISSWNVDVVI